MESDKNRNRRWRPQFSVRTLAIFVTLMCVYFACWELTKKYGATTGKGVMKEKDSAWINLPSDEAVPEKIVVSAESPFPFVISCSEYEFNYFVARGDHKARRISVAEGPQRYYLWLFGPKFKLPFESTW